MQKAIVVSLIGVSSLLAACAVEEESSDSPDNVFEEIPTPGSKDGREIANATSADCPSGHICFFTGSNLTGSICRWSGNDNSWTGGAVTCSWATSRAVCSVWNRSRGNVEYFLARDYVGRIGSTNAGVAGNLACNYNLLSHRCSSGSCF